MCAQFVDCACIMSLIAVGMVCAMMKTACACQLTPFDVDADIRSANILSEHVAPVYLLHLLRHQLCCMQQR